MWVRDEATFVPELDGEGFWQGFMLDITERKRAEDQLREAELKFRTIVEQNQAIFYTQEIDPDDPAVSRTTYIAPGNTEMLGYTLEDIQDDPTLWRAIVHPDDRERVFEADAESNLVERRLRLLDGVPDDQQGRAHRLGPGRGHAGAPRRQAPLLAGIPARRHRAQGGRAQLERALDVEREATQRLRALDEMKNTFLQAVSHDLRTPLAAILGLAITLERGDIQLEDDDAKDLAHRIAVERAPIGPHGHQPARPRPARARHRGSQARVDRRRRPPPAVLDETDLIEDSRLETDLQPVVQPIDAAKVERIVENLLANTVRHTPSNASIWVRVWPEPDGVTIAVEDTGPGVPRRAPRHVFEPFRQGAEAPQHSPGVGVGLDAGAPVRRAARRTRVGPGTGRRRRLVPGVPAGGRADRAGAARRPRCVRCFGRLVGAPATGRLGRGVLSRPLLGGPRAEVEVRHVDRTGHRPVEPDLDTVDISEIHPRERRQREPSCCRIT